MSALQALAGALWLRPGVARPHNLRSTRPELVERLTTGLAADRLPAVLGSVFSLCGHAHTVCAERAVAAARGQGCDVPEATRSAHALHTLREHVRRIGLDWPHQLAAGSAGKVPRSLSDPDLARCPAFASTPGDATAWIEAHWLGESADTWLSAWREDPADWLDRWSRRAPTALAALLRGAQPFARDPLPALSPLRVHGDADALRAWQATRDAADARRPRWQGACAETGVWTRLNEASTAALDTAWLRLGARLTEAVRLTQGGGSRWLDLGALALGGGAALAWIETARGLLVHRVQLDGTGPEARVARCHVIAPTDWNFHPDGAVARVLERMPSTPSAGARRVLAITLAAYDPCVTFELEPAPSAEPSHA